MNNKKIIYYHFNEHSFEYGHVDFYEYLYANFKNNYMSIDKDIKMNIYI